MSGINKFFGKTAAAAVNKTAQFEKLKQGKSKEEVRELEQNLLKPVELPPFTKKHERIGALNDLSVKLVFPNPERFALFERHFRVSRRVEQSVHNLKKLFALLEALENETITYDEETDSVTCP